MAVNWAWLLQGLMVLTLTLQLIQHYPHQLPSWGWTIRRLLTEVAPRLPIGCGAKSVRNKGRVVTPSPVCRATSPEGNWLVLPAVGQTTVEIWNIANRTLRGQFQGDTATSSSYRAQFSQPDDRLLIISSTQVQLLNLASGVFSPVLRHDQAVSDAVLSPDKTLVVVSTVGDEQSKGGILKYGMLPAVRTWVRSCWRRVRAAELFSLKTVTFLPPVPAMPYKSGTRKIGRC